MSDERRRSRQASRSAGFTNCRMNNILVIKLRYIGDVLLATPVLRSLKSAYPRATLTVVVNPGTEEMLANHPDVSEVLVLPRGSWLSQLRFLYELRRRRFDCVLDLTDGDRAALLAWFCGAPVRVGFNDERRWRGILYTQIARPPAGGHRIEHDLSILHPLGVSPITNIPTLTISDNDDRGAERILHEAGVSQQATEGRLVMLQPAARYWFKAWPEDRFAILADRLTTVQGCHVLIGGSPQDRELAERICRGTRTGCTVIAGRTTLLEYAAILKRCVLFVGNDSGAMHMAAAMGTPLVALFGPSDPGEWGPRGGPAHAIYKGLDCRACFHPTCRRGAENCMQLITVDEVYAAALRMMNKREYVSGYA